MSNAPRSLNSTIIAAQQQLLELEARRLATPEPAPMPRTSRWRRLVALALAPLATAALVTTVAGAAHLAGSEADTAQLVHQVPAVQLGVDRLEASTIDAAIHPVGQLEPTPVADVPATSSERKHTPSSRDRDRDRDRDRTSSSTTSTTTDTGLGGRSLGGGILGNDAGSTSGSSGSSSSFGNLESVDVFGAGGELRQ